MITCPAYYKLLLISTIERQRDPSIVLLTRETPFKAVQSSHFYSLSKFGPQSIMGRFRNLELSMYSVTMFLLARLRYQMPRKCEGFHATAGKIRYDMELKLRQVLIYLPFSFSSLSYTQWLDHDTKLIRFFYYSNTVLAVILRYTLVDLNI